MHKLLAALLLAVAVVLVPGASAISAPAHDGYDFLGAEDANGGDLSHRSCKVTIGFCVSVCNRREGCAGFTWVDTVGKPGGCCYTKATINLPLVPFRDTAREGVTYAKIVPLIPADPSPDETPGGSRDPIPGEAVYTDLTSAFRGDGRLFSFGEAVIPLEASSDVTVFVPTSEAMEAFLAANDNLLGLFFNNTDMSDVLGSLWLLHSVRGIVNTPQLRDGLILEALGGDIQVTRIGDAISISLDGQPDRSANIVGTQVYIEGANMVIHEIDAVLFRGNIQKLDDVRRAMYNDGELMGALTLYSTFSPDWFNVTGSTIFAATDAAYEAMNEAAGLDGGSDPSDVAAIMEALMGLARSVSSVWLHRGGAFKREALTAGTGIFTTDSGNVFVEAAPDGGFLVSVLGTPEIKAMIVGKQIYVASLDVVVHKINKVLTSISSDSPIDNPNSYIPGGGGGGIPGLKDILDNIGDLGGLFGNFDPNDMPKVEDPTGDDLSAVELQKIMDDLAGLMGGGGGGGFDPNDMPKVEDTSGSDLTAEDIQKLMDGLGSGGGNLGGLFGGLFGGRKLRAAAGRAQRA
ncbi:hypothetical protein FOA52_002523 [Chlamydomonas sp. UWO 241]|nr:hypothetical protein FOA52_002523 [Chlamydomonas sp. UWO 241]